MRLWRRCLEDGGRVKESSKSNNTQADKDREHRAFRNNKRKRKELYLRIPGMDLLRNQPRLWVKMALARRMVWVLVVFRQCKISSRRCSVQSLKVE